MVALAVFAHDKEDLQQREAWNITRTRIREAFEKLRDEIKFIQCRSVVVTGADFRTIREAKTANLLIWGRFRHFGNTFKIEPRITLLNISKKQELTVMSPRDTSFAFSEAFSEPEDIELVESKADEIKNIIVVAYGFAKVRSNDFNAAFNSFSAVDPHTKRTLLWTGNCLVSLGRFKEAAHYFQRSTFIDSTYPDAWYNWGVALRNMDSLDECLSKYQKATLLKPSFLLAWNNWGVVLSKLGNYKEAMSTFDEGIANYDPKRSDETVLAKLWYNSGLAIAQLDSFEKAATRFEKAIGLGFNHPSIWYNVGVVLGSLNRDDKAIAAYEKAIELDSGYFEAWFNLGGTFAKIGDFQMALARYEKCLELEPNNAEAWGNYGVCLEKTGRHNEAILAYQKAIGLNSFLAVPYLNLGRMMRESTRHGVGRQYLLKAKELFLRQGNERAVREVDSLLN